MKNNSLPTPPDKVGEIVQLALAEDIGSGDVTATLIPEKQVCTAEIICRDRATICGLPWVEAVFRNLAADIMLDWAVEDGSQVEPDTCLARLKGPTRAILTGERCALNFLQTLSATATATRHYVDLLAGNQVRLLDTRKTLPGLRSAQKYAVACGGGHNHRQGLYDAFLIKENHIAASGSIRAALVEARNLHPDLLLEVEVETFEELREAKEASPDVILLDNFSLDELRRAVRENNHPVRFEASGGIGSEEELLQIAATGIDYISVGALTKHIRAVDLSLRLTATHMLLE